MNKRLLLVVSAVACIAVASILLRSLRINFLERGTDDRFRSSEEEIITGGLPAVLIDSSLSLETDEVEPVMERHSSSTSLPELSPTRDLTGAKLGQLRIKAVEEMGDVYRLFWHEPTRSLLMAMVERDGMRAIWRLNSDGAVERVLELDRRPGDFMVTGDSRGVLYAQFENPGRLYRSGDGGNSWKPVLSGVDMFWQMTDDGQGTIYGAAHAINRAILYRSTDDGFTWEEWIDFHELYPEYAKTYAKDDPRFSLRHLHGVTWVGGKLLVGVGDVTRFTVMSDDGGKTWQKIWDEGYTGSAVAQYGNFVLLGPDTISRFSLAIYDTLTGETSDVWSPSANGYAGYTYSIIEHAGAYYAAFHTEANEVGEIVPKFGVIASPDGYTWYPLLEFGPLTNHATTMMFLSSGEDRIFLSMNGALYGFAPLDRSWFKENKPFAE